MAARRSLDNDASLHRSSELNASLNLSAVTPMQQHQQEAAGDEDVFDDTLDDIVNCVPDPVSEAGPSMQTPSTNYSTFANVGGCANQSSFAAALPLLPAQQSTQESFDPHVYQDVMDDSLLRLSRKICGLDESRGDGWRSRRRVLDHQSDDEFLFED